MTTLEKIIAAGSIAACVLCGADALTRAADKSPATVQQGPSFVPDGGWTFQVMPAKGNEPILIIHPDGVVEWHGHIVQSDVVNIGGLIRKRLARISGAICAGRLAVSTLTRRTAICVLPMPEMSTSESHHQ